MRVITIQTDHDVAALAMDVRTGKRRRADEIKVELKGLSPDQAAEISRELNQRYFSCGCKESSAFGLAGLGVALSWALLVERGWMAEGLVVAGAFVIAVGVGKAIGRWRAKVALNRSMERLFALAPGARELGKGDGSARCAVGK